MKHNTIIVVEDELATALEIIVIGGGFYFVDYHSFHLGTKKIKIR
jgi:hypothetical protein